MATRSRDEQGFPFETDVTTQIGISTGGLWLDDENTVLIRITDADTHKVIGELRMSLESFSRAALAGHGTRPARWLHWSETPIVEDTHVQEN